MSLKIGSLFSGYEGLGMGVQSVIGGEIVWHADVCRFDKDGNAGHYEPHRAPCSILAHHWPDVPNHGDITKINWQAVEPVDALLGGFPCQDLSHAGKQAGLRPDTRSGLWSHMAYAIDQLRPSLVVAENVRGLLSAEAHSDVEPCSWCVGDGPDGALRALGAVLGDLADLGYDAAWCGLRASDVGAPHGRFRVFVVAWPVTDTPGARCCEGQDARASSGDAGAWAWGREPQRVGGERGDSEPLSLLRTPTAQLAVNGGSQHPDKRRAGGHGPTLADEVEHLLPTPAVNDMGEGKTPEAWDEWTAKMQAAHGNGNGHGKSLAIEAQRLLPTPSVADVEGGRKHRSGDRSDELLLNGLAAEWGDRLLPTPTSMDSHASGGGYNGQTNVTLTDATVRQPDRFGDYGPAIARWEAITRPAPEPTEPTGKGGSHRLSPAFVEWMMGLPVGHVTDVPGVSRNDQLKALGNGVVPQQAAAAVRFLLAHVEEAAA